MKLAGPYQPAEPSRPDLNVSKFKSLKRTDASLLEVTVITLIYAPEEKGGTG